MVNTVRTFHTFAFASVVVIAAGLAGVARGEDSSDLAGALFGGAPQSSRKDAGQRIDVAEFPDADITDILRMVSDNSGWSIFASKSAKVRVSLSAKNITARDLLDRAVAAAGLVYHEENGIINVMSFDEYAEAFGLTKRVIGLKHASASDVAEILSPFLTKNGKVSIQETGNRVVLVDTQASLTEIGRVVESLDVPSAVSQVEVVKLAHRDAAEVVALVTQYTSMTTTGSGSASSRTTATRSQNATTTIRPNEGLPRVVSAPFSIFADVQTNAVLLIGAAEDRRVIKELITSLDTPEMRTIRTYPIRNIDAQEVFDALEKVYAPSGGQWTGAADERLRRVAISKQTNAITVFGTAADHAQAESLVQSMDIPIPEGPGRVRVYSLENSKAEDVAALLAGLTGGENTTPSIPGERSRLGSAEVMGITSVERLGAWGGELAAAAAPSPESSATPLAAGSQPAGLGTALQQRPRIAANASTNSVVVWATPSDQQAVEQIIRQIDRRRPQVQIEAVLVELSADDNLNIGVEWESWQPGTHGDTTTLFFTSFGLSTIDPNTGQRVLVAQPGVGAAILRPDEVPFVLSALQATGKASIMSYPKVLVNDNVPGTISSIREEPYTQVNASNTVATTSFGGYVQAGIQFAVVPHISENSYLRLEYQVQLNSFVGASTVVNNVTVPPARDTNTIQSEVTVPDNHTIIIGGLRRQVQTETVRKVPLLGDIPGVGLLFQSLTKTNRTVTLFFFLRPQILRDDRFLALKLISQQEADRVDIERQWPRNPAITISNRETYQSWQIETGSRDVAVQSQPSQ